VNVPKSFPSKRATGSPVGLPVGHQGAPRRCGLDGADRRASSVHASLSGDTLSGEDMLCCFYLFTINNNNKTSTMHHNRQDGGYLHSQRAPRVGGATVNNQVGAL